MKHLIEKLLTIVAPTIAGVAITVSYLPQIYLTATTQNVSGQSLSFWLILDIALLGSFLQQLGMLLYKKCEEPHRAPSPIPKSGILFNHDDLRYLIPIGKER